PDPVARRPVSYERNPAGRYTLRSVGVDREDVRVRKVNDDWRWTYPTNQPSVGAGKGCCGGCFLKLGPPFRRWRTMVEAVNVRHPSRAVRAFVARQRSSEEFATLPMKRLLIALLLVGSLGISPLTAQMQMERLGRGVVAVRTGTSMAYVGWRLLGTDRENI